ncbi:putative UDP-glucuronosyltransferase [Tripterygium wilfordii]|uniref:Glycosyltransferase n=1 Tax=Tripterygium wilfordii TaxID=458696 RepID=A0A7J7DRK6_TRIWF|nr:UDP-glycosyltransferase 83A1-like [Tripterygium wilfordii]KAF5748931.1 putative UDP-glucuronosyltransferase [Tripterygium wilfordii]
MGNPHILVVPYPAQGHIIPLVEISLCLAKLGFKITFVNTEYNHDQVKRNLQGDVGVQINLVSVSDGMEPGESRNQPGKASGAILQVMPGKIEELIERINGSESEKITCILADQSIGWALEIAEKKGIQRAAFCPAAAALLVLGFSIPKLINDGIIDNNGTPTKEQTIKLSPTMPAMNTKHFVWACLGNTSAQKHIFQLMVRNNQSMKLTDWQLCNSTYDLEPAAFTLAPHIVPIGPLHASNQLENLAGNFLPEDSTCLTWLDQQPPESVVYIAFGSTTVLDQTQFKQLAHGLELLNRPFLWVVRPNITEGTNLKEFQDRVRDRGQIVDWAPQKKVLAHPSIACFITHCGWNSTIEGVNNGVPLLCWPYFADQFINQSYICDIWSIGLGFNRDQSGIITSSEIKNKIEQLLGNKNYKERALDLKEKITNSIKEEGTSHKNFNNFIEWLRT